MFELGYYEHFEIHVKLSLRFLQESLLLSGDKFERASELMRLLSLEKSMRAAITLVTKLKLPFLAEKFCSILEVLYKNFHFIHIALKRRKIIYRLPLPSFFVMLTSGSSLTGKVA